jgi:hypothetical protein
VANLLKMAEVQAILALAQGGWSIRRIARHLGVDRETVSRHLRIGAWPGDSKPASAPLGSGAPDCGLVSAPTGSAAVAGGAPLGSITAEPAANLVLDGAPTGSDGGSAALVSAAGPWRLVIEQKLEAGLTARRIFQDLRDDHGYGGSYYSVRRLIRKLTGATPAPFRRMECEAGAEAQVDFGRGAPVVPAGCGM